MKLPRSINKSYDRIVANTEINIVTRRASCYRKKFHGVKEIGSIPASGGPHSENLSNVGYLVRLYGQIVYLQHFNNVFKHSLM